MKTRDQIIEEFTGDGLSINEYLKIYNKRMPVDVGAKEKLFMEVLLDIRDLLTPPQQ